MWQQHYLVVLAILVVGWRIGVLAELNTAATLENDNRLHRYVDLLDRFGVSPSIGLTLFVPTMTAWKNYEQANNETWTRYNADGQYFAVHFEELITWHLVTEDVFTVNEIFDGTRKRLGTMTGNITIQQTTNPPKLDNVPKTTIDSSVTTTTAIIHVLDQVIVPPYLTTTFMEQLLNNDDLRNSKFTLTTMANLFIRVEMEDELDEWYENGLTLLVPPNRRFNRAQINVVNLMTNDELKPYLRDFLRCHLIPDVYHQSKILALHQQADTQQSVVTTKLGTSLWMTTTEDRLRFQSEDVVLADQPTRNGIFHIMDMPLQPPFISDFVEFTDVSTTWDTNVCFRFFRLALLSSEEISVMFNTSLTMFCPTDAAYAEFNKDDRNRLLEPKWKRHGTEFLLNHLAGPALSRSQLLDLAPSTITMLSGQTYNLKKSGDRPRIQNDRTGDNSRSDFGDLIGLDGYVHIVDTVITPTTVLRSIYDQSRDNPDFSTLTELIDFVRLTDIVDRDLPLTFLAPPNWAWERITISALEPGEVVQRHLFEGLLFCDVLANETSITSVNEFVSDVELRGPNSEHVYVGGSFIYNCDMLAANGVLHHVDRVIGEPYDTVAPSLSPSPTETPQPTIPIPPTLAPVPTGAAPISFPPVETPSPDSGPSTDDDPPTDVAGLLAPTCSVVGSLLACTVWLW